MARVYSVSFENVAVAADQDFIYVAPADDKPVKLLGFFLSNVGGTADAGDAKEQFCRLAVVRGHATVGSGGNSFTPVPIDPNDAAAGFTARINDTTPASAGTAVNVHADGFNVRAGYQIWFPPDLQPRVTQAAGVTMVIRLVADPAESVTMSGCAYFEEE